MKNKISILAIIVLAFSVQPLALASYTVTNDLSSIFQLFYWTNATGTNYVTSLATNLAPSSNTVFTVSTNGAAGLGVQPTNSTQPIMVPWTNLPATSAFMSVLFSDALLEIAPAVETVPQTQLILKSYFITGAVPTQANYWEGIDTAFWYINQTYIWSVQAASNAAVAVASNPTAATEALHISNTNPMVTWTRTNFISSINYSRYTGGGGYWYYITNNFANSFPDTAYACVAVRQAGNLSYIGETNNPGSLQCAMILKQTNSCVFLYKGTTPENSDVYFVFYK